MDATVTHTVFNLAPIDLGGGRHSPGTKYQDLWLSRAVVKFSRQFLYDFRPFAAPSKCGPVRPAPRTLLSTPLWRSS